MIINELEGGKLIVRSIMNQLWFNERFMLGDVPSDVLGGFNFSWIVPLHL